MSRHPIAPKSIHNQAEEYVNFVAANSAPRAITLEELRTATTQDPTLQYVISTCHKGYWPRDIDQAVDRLTITSLKAVPTSQRNKTGDSKIASVPNHGTST
jgi:hypothetical protein